MMEGQLIDHKSPPQRQMGTKQHQKQTLLKAALRDNANDRYPRL